MISRIFFSLLVLLANCSDKKQTVNCSLNEDLALKAFNNYLDSRQKASIDSATFSVNKAIECNPRKPRIFWTKILIELEKDNHREVIRTISKFEHIYGGPDVYLYKGQSYIKLGERDSANMSLERSLFLFDSLLVDTVNSSLVSQRLEAIIYLKGRREALLELEADKIRYPEMVELRSLNLLLDSL